MPFGICSSALQPPAPAPAPAPKNLAPGAMVQQEPYCQVRVLTSLIQSKVCLCGLDSYLSAPRISALSNKVGSVIVPSSQGCWSTEWDVQLRLVLSFIHRRLLSGVHAAGSKGAPDPLELVASCCPTNRCRNSLGTRDDRTHSLPSKETREGRLAQVSRPVWLLPLASKPHGVGPLLSSSPASLWRV